MLTFKDAQQRLLEQATPVTATEPLALTKALGRVLASDIVAAVDVPPADNSAMDGYAINLKDIKQSNRLPISQTIAAGHVPTSLIPGTAARIFTGAEIPIGANAVVMQEQCNVENNAVTLPEEVPLNNNIRPRGQDIAKGQTLLPMGRQLQAQDIGLLASIGVDTVSVYRKLTVAILSTGDELCEPGQALQPGQIYNSNRYLLQGFLQDMGVDILDMGVIPDTLADTIVALKQAAQADCILSTGGVSVGDEDHIKNAVDHLGELTFWRIAIKPGKPLAFAHINHKQQQTPFIGLPGNPASVFTTFLLFAKPFLTQQQGQDYTFPKGVKLTAAFHKKMNPKRQEYLRAKINPQGEVDIYPNQSSGVLSSTSWAEGFAVIPPATEITPGMDITFLHFNEL